MASQTHGIQQLLAAEKRAAEKVSEARRRNILINNLLFYKRLVYIYIFFLIFIRQTKTLEEG